MAGGSLDSRGVWQYGEDDERDEFSALLNIGQASTSTAIGADRARLASLESAGTLSSIATSGIVIASSGWQTVLQEAFKKNGIAFLSLQFKRTGSNLPVGADGDIGNEELAAFQPNWTPAYGIGFPLTVRLRLGSGYSSADHVVLTALGPGTTMNTNATIWVATTFPLG